MKTIAVLFCLSFFPVIANCQIQRDTNPSQSSSSVTSTRDKNKQLLRELNLTKEEQGQLKEFRQTQKQKRNNIQNDPSLTNEQKQQKLKDLRIEQKEKLNSILTPEQKQQLIEARKNGKIKKGSN